MKTLIVGTCGHIDHGKTSLIKALTGVDTDRLKEEKRRGITIDLGFTDYNLPSKNRIAFVDVPGHEKFVKNMIAGITGVNHVMFIISGEEGIMPQTIEHLEIIKGLGVENGVIVISKCDKSSEDIIELIEEEVRELFKGSPLENSKIIRTSTKTREGLEELTEYFEEEVGNLKEIDDSENFRMNIDRVFTIQGSGTVVTGTIINGEVKEGDRLFICKKNIEVKGRGIQGYGKKVEKLSKGNRCAINISGVDKEDVSRGDVLTSDPNLKSSFIIDCKIKTANEEDLVLKNRQRVRFYVGTKEAIGRVYILNKEEISKNEEAYIQVRLEEDVISKKDDYFYIRNFSPIHNIGGGKIIEPNAKKAKGDKEKYIKNLILKEKGSLKDNIISILNKEEFLDINELSKMLGENESEISKEIEELKKEERIVVLGNCNKNIILSKVSLGKIEDRLKEILSVYHKKNPLDSGISKEELRKKLITKEIKKNEWNDLIDYLSDDIIDSNNGIVSLKGFKKRLSLNGKNFKRDLLEELNKGFANVNLKEILNKHSINEEEGNKILILLEEEKEIVRLNEGVILSESNFDRGVKTIRDHFKNNDSITLGDCRDLLNTNRKIAVSFLEELDKRKITKRNEKDRVLL